jgi:hypothetical protein
MATSDENIRRLQLMQTASDELEAAINHLEEAGSLDEIVLLLRTAENNLEDEVIRLEDQPAE